jgi:asparagine synthase (glutamine-hydrolysing)
MPGISLKCDLNKKIKADDNEKDEIFLKALNSIIHNDFYKREILLSDDLYLVGCTKYPQYPVKIFEDSEYWVCFEGKIYGKQHSVLRNEINELMNRIFNTRSNIQGDKKIISDWLLKTDGDFVIYALNKKSKDFVIMNDVLGRLPIYYFCNDGKTLLVSRELQFISYFIQESYDYYDNNNNDKFDRMGIAQFLLFCHTLGKRTLLSNIYRLEPANLLTVYNDNSEIKIDNLYQYNFENKKYVNDSLKKNAQQLVSLFSDACRSRVDSNAKNLITLSGGLDSRTIAAWFHKNKIPAYAVTTVDPSWKPFVGNLSDAEVAKQIAKLLNIQWEYYDFVEPRAKDLVMLLRIKKGLTYLAYGFLMQFIDKLKHKHDSSSINVFVGYSGDRILADLSMRYTSLDELTRSIMSIRVFLPLKDVAALVQIKENEIVDEIRNTLSSYPEKNLGQKLVHFVFYGRQFKFVFEAEDIHRLYFWIVNPFYSIPFFNYAMNCADEYKSQEALYREFLYLMSPLAAQVESSNWGCSILSKKFKIVQYVLTLTWKYPIFKKFLKKFIKRSRDVEGYKKNAKIIQCMRDQLNNCDTISNYLSCKEIEKIMNNSGNYRPTGIDNLFTVMSLMERTLCGNCTIEKFYDD